MKTRADEKKRPVHDGYMTVTCRLRDGCITRHGEKKRPVHDGYMPVT